MVVADAAYGASTPFRLGLEQRGWSYVLALTWNERGRQTARTPTSAGGPSNRTMTWSSYPDGKLKSTEDDVVPVGKWVVLVHNSDTQNTSTTGTWAAGNITGRQGCDHRTHAAGTGADAFTWTLNVPTDGTHTAYVKYPQVTGSTTSAKYTRRAGWIQLPHRAGCGGPPPALPRTAMEPDG